MIDYAAIAADALIAIRDAGTVLNCSRNTNTIHPVTEAVTVATATGRFDGVVLPAKRNPFAVSMDSAEIENLRLGKAKRLLLAANGATFPPVVGDILTVGTEAYRLTGVTDIAPAGVPVIYLTEGLKL